MIDDLKIKAEEKILRTCQKYNDKYDCKKNAKIFCL